MIQPSNSSTKLQPRHHLLIAGLVVVAAVIAYGAFSFIVGTVAFLVKLAIVLGLAYLFVRFLVHRARH